MKTNSNLRHGRTFNTVYTIEETVNINNNATNISTSQQNHQHQHQKPITLKYTKRQRNRRHHKRHIDEASKQRDVREANYYMEVEHEPLPQALQQRMVFDDSIYEDDDDDDNDEDENDYNPSQQSPVINIDRNFHIDMEQPIKVLTLGGNNEAEKPQQAHQHKLNDATDDDDDDDDDSDNGANNNNPLSAINIISTPLEEFEIGLKDSNKKTTQSFTDFDALAPVSESSNSNKKAASSSSKIVPVITADGQVALLYREDEETTVKNVQVNITKQLDNNNKQADKVSATAATDDEYDYDGDDDDEEEVDEEEINATIMQKLNDAAAGKSNDGPATDVQKDAESAEEARVAANQAPTSSSTLLRPTDSILPMINRPLSEVLGIKKNQFKTFRIKDDATSTSTTTSSTTTTSTTSTTPQPAHVLASGIEVVPHEVPITHLMPTPREFDFSHDSTMLDERSREKAQQQHPNTLENEVLTQTDFIDLALLPHIEQELTRLQQQEKRRHYHSKRNKHRPRTAEELSSIHFVMQIMMGIAAVTTMFGMLGTFFKQRILDQLRMLH